MFSLSIVLRIVAHRFGRIVEFVLSFLSASRLSRVASGVNDGCIAVTLLVLVKVLGMRDFGFWNRHKLPLEIGGPHLNSRSIVRQGKRLISGRRLFLEDRTL